MTLLRIVAALMDEVMIVIEHDCTILLEWFRDNFMTLNASKCHLLVSRYKHDAISVEDALFLKKLQQN